MGQGGAGRAHHAEDVDVQDPVPLGVVVVLDGALGADARVVDQYVKAAEVGDGGRDSPAYGGVVADVRLVSEQGFVDARRVQVEDGYLGAAGGQEFRGGPADAGRAARHQRLEPRKVLGVGHAAAPFRPVSR